MKKPSVKTILRSIAFILIIGLTAFVLYYQFFLLVFSAFATFPEYIDSMHYIRLVFNVAMIAVLFWMLGNQWYLLFRKQYMPKYPRLGKSLGRILPVLLILIAAGAAAQQLQNSIYFLKSEDIGIDGILFAISFLICLWCIWWHVNKLVALRKAEQTPR